jgi:pyridoxal phosphate enzyme (YggS family)
VIKITFNLTPAADYSHTDNTPMSSSIDFNIAKVQQRIRDAEKKYLRKAHSVQLMAVSKTRPAEQIRQAAAAGIKDIGENYLQEALQKQAQLQDLALRWHFIGPIQANKTRAIAEHFDWVHSVDRLKIAQRLNDQRPANLPPLNICLQINISNETTKSGISLAQLPELLKQCHTLPNICLRGVMAVPAASSDTQALRQQYALLRDTVVKLQYDYATLDTLSLGMSADMEHAIAEGSTMVRIGSDIFGPRAP